MRESRRPPSLIRALEIQCLQGSFVYIQDYYPLHDCMRKVDTKAVMTVRMKLPSFSALGILRNFMFYGVFF